MAEDPRVNVLYLCALKEIRARARDLGHTTPKSLIAFTPEAV